MIETGLTKANSSRYIGAKLGLFADASMVSSISLILWLSSVLQYKNQFELNEIKDTHQRSVLLRKVIDRIWNSLEMEGTSIGKPIQTAVDEVAKILGLERCSFLWYFPNTQRVKIICERVGKNQKPMQGASYPLEMFGLSASAIADGKIFIRYASYSESGWFDIITRLLWRSRFGQKHLRQNLTRENMVNLLVPVCQITKEETPGQEKRIGFIACFSDRPRNWSASEIEFVQLIAQQLEIAIRQSQLYEQTQKQAKREKLINKITTQTRQSFDLEKILNSAIAQLLDALEVDRCLVHLVENTGEQKHREKENGERRLGVRNWENSSPVPSPGGLETRPYPITSPQSKSFWETAHQIAYRRQHLYEVCRETFAPSIDDFDTQGPITQWVIQHRESVIITDVTKDPRIGEKNEEYQKASIKSSLVVPVQANNVLHGILYLNQCSYNRYWSSSDRELAQAVANQLAISIQQACLYAQTLATVERESLLRLISDQIRSTLDLKTILQTAVREVQSFLNTDRVEIYQFNEASQGEIVVEKTTDKWASIWTEMSQNRCFLTQYTYPYQGEGVQIIDDILNAEIEDKHLVFLQQLQVRASLVVPIVRAEESSVSKETESSGNKLWGLLIVQECTAPRVWKETEVTLLQQLATQVAIAIQQAELYKKSQLTAAVAQAKAEALEKALSELKQTQAQLIQTEKMSSLGQLVAGVAHEINNPVNFIYGNLSYAHNYTKELLKLVSLYQKYYPDPEPEIQDYAEEMDLDFLMNDMPKILSSMKVGADRIRQIVLTLRNFSRVDQAEMKPADIHEGIENTLLILQNRLKGSGQIPQIEVIKEYGELPLVECFAGQLNQVFMNILCNAIDCLEEVGRYSALGNEFESTPIPTIRIRTEISKPNYVTVRIADNGPGMTEQVKTRLFDAFFTTKSVGQGTGLGLSISYQIVVEKHHGSIRCESAPGEGAEFWIEIPVEQPK